ncbi:MAG: hypothetical protein GXX80_00615 [Thermotogaceae bacterium]|nr:hypothetical protein [Thermotogaceae bacterium]
MHYIILRGGSNVIENKVAYEILYIKDFGKGMHRRTAKIKLLENNVTREDLQNLTRDIWLEHGQDVDELVTVFYLPDMDTSSVSYAFGGCMKGKGCYLTVDQ